MSGTMQIKKIAPIIKKSNRLFLNTDKIGNQWVGNGHAWYELTGLPTFGLNGICAVLDIPPDVAGEMLTNVEAFETVTDVDPENYERGTMLAMDENRTLTIDGVEVIPLTNGVTARFLPSKFLEPIKDCAQLELELLDNNMIIAIDGLFPVAVFTAGKLSTEHLSWFGNLYSMCNTANREAATSEKE